MKYKIYARALIEELNDIVSHFFCKVNGGDEDLIKESEEIINEIKKCFHHKYEN